MVAGTARAGPDESTERRRRRTMQTTKQAHDGDQRRDDDPVAEADVQRLAPWSRSRCLRARVRSNSSVWACTAPLASMSAEMPEIAACTTGRPVSAARICPIATCWAEFAERAVGAVVRRHDDHLGAVAHERADLVAERRLEADDRRDLVARRCRRARVRRRVRSRAGCGRARRCGPRGGCGTARARRTARGGAWRTCPARSPSGPYSTLRFTARPSGASATALASTHASCSDREVARAGLPRHAIGAAGPRPCTTRGTR